MPPSAAWGGLVRLYFEAPGSVGKTRIPKVGRVPGSPLPFLGPKTVLYADGSRTGAAGVVDFEDWEPRST